MIQNYPWTKAEAGALRRAWHTDEGRAAITFIVEKLGDIHGQSLVLGSPDHTAFNEGRRWMARQVMHAATMSEEQLIQEETDGSASRGTNSSTSGTSGDQRIRDRNRRSRANA